MATNKLIIQIQAETDKAEREVEQLTKEVKKLSTQNKEFSRTSTTDIKKVTKGFGSLKTTLVGVATSLAALGVITKGIEFAKMAADAEQAGDAFEKVFTDMGLVAEKEFNNIKEASLGLIPDAAIRQSAVTAASLGVPIEKLAQLMEIARAKAREMGTDAQAAFNDLAVGIGRGSPMILDNLGLTIKLGDANKKYAEDLGITIEAMSKQDKQMALTNAVIEAGTDSVERFSTAGLSSKESLQKMNAQIENLQVKIGTALLPVINQLIEDTSKWIESLKDEDVQAFGNAIGGLVEAVVALVRILAVVNDLILPDWIFGKDAGLIDTTAKAIIAVGDALVSTDEKLNSTTGGGSSWGDELATSADKASASIGKVADKAQEAKQEIESEPVVVEVESDIDKTIREYNEALGKLSNAPVKIDADMSAADAKIDKTKTKAKTPTKSVHTVQVDASKAIAVIDKLQQPTSSTHTVYVNEVVSGSSSSSGSRGFASGGYTGSGSNSQPAGIVHKNEFVIPAYATKALGVDNLYRMISGLKGYENGGLVGGGQTTTSALQPINLNIGGNSFGALIPKEVANALQTYISEEGGL